MPWTSRRLWPQDLRRLQSVGHLRVVVGCEWDFEDWIVKESGTALLILTCINLGIWRLGRYQAELHTLNARKMRL